MSNYEESSRAEAGQLGQKGGQTRKENEGGMGMGQGESRSYRGGGGDNGNLGANTRSDREADDFGKDPARVEAGKKAAETRKEREGDDVFHKLGEKGAEARWGHGSAQSNENENENESGRRENEQGTSYGGKNPARVEAGKKGAEARWNQSQQQ